MELPERVDVAVIGGGLAGLATAWALRERGGAALVLERDDRIASHASGRNAAMCRALAEDDAWTAVTAAGAAFLLDPPAGFAAGPLVDRRGAVLLAGERDRDRSCARGRRGSGCVTSGWPTSRRAGPACRRAAAAGSGSPTTATSIWRR